jgi:cell division protein FtsB
VLARIQPYLPTAFLALLIFYFGVNALTGDRGLLHGHRRNQTLASSSLELKRLRAQREELEVEVRLLSDQSLSRDLLEERSRSLLGFADPSDYVIRNLR